MPLIRYRRQGTVWLFEEDILHFSLDFRPSFGMFVLFDAVSIRFGILTHSSSDMCYEPSISNLKESP